MVSAIIAAMTKTYELIPNPLAAQNVSKMPNKGGHNVDGGAPLDLAALATPRPRVHNECVPNKRRSMQYQSSTYYALKGNWKITCLLTQCRLCIVAPVRRMKSRIDFPDLACALGCWAHVYTAEGDLVDIIIRCLAGCWAILVAMFKAAGIYM